MKTKEALCAEVPRPARPPSPPTRLRIVRRCTYLEVKLRAANAVNAVTLPAHPRHGCIAKSTMHCDEGIKVRGVEARS